MKIMCLGVATVLTMVSFSRGQVAPDTPGWSGKRDAVKREQLSTAPGRFTPATVADHAFQLRGPKDYDPTTEYPLLIYLHGGGNNGTDNQKPLRATPMSVKSDELQNEHPTFVYIPQCPPRCNWGSPAALKMLEQTITHLKAVYPIDETRLYLAGFSMGGSGSYHVAKHLYEATGQPFAAVVRCAGQSDYPMATHAILAKSAVWIHIGSKDTPPRVQLARDSYEKLRQIHFETSADADRSETRRDLTITSPGKTYHGHTRALTKDGVTLALITEYPDEGHTTWGFPFRNPQVFKWLFVQRTGKPAKP